MTTLRAEVRFKNARLYNAIVDAALPALAATHHARQCQRAGPIKPWCDALGFSFGEVYLLLNLRRDPRRVVDKDGIQTIEFRPIAIRLANALDVSPEWLFPADLYRQAWPSYAIDLDHRTVRLTAARAAGCALPANQDEARWRDELRARIEAILPTLTPRQAQILRLRFGLEANAEPLTLEATALVVGVTRERIRQIEARALRRMRNPSHANALRPFMDDLEPPRRAKAAEGEG